MKVSELSGYMLDMWVARCEGVDAVISDERPNGSRGCVTYYSRGGNGRLDGRSYCPSDHWSDGGPIIERDQIFLDPPHDAHHNGGPNAGWKRYDQWTATVSARTRTWLKGDDDLAKMTGGRVGRGAGETPLIAAMRAKVASHYGDEVPDAP